MHTELKTKSQRSSNIVVTGLPISQIASDAVQFLELCQSELDISIKITFAIRLGQKTPGKIQPLLVTLESADNVEHIMYYVRDLRHSTSPFVRENIFINRHLTRAESLAAYHARVQRRQKKQCTLMASTLDTPALNMDVTAAEESDAQNSNRTIFVEDHSNTMSTNDPIQSSATGTTNPSP